MMKTAIAAILFAFPAMASEVTMEGLVITHSNERTFGAADDEDFRFSIPEGDVIVHLHRVNEGCNTRPSCPDTLTVVSLPTGMRAEPESVTTPEGGRGEIEIIPYFGF